MANIILIGFTGVGKSRISRQMVKDSNYISIDTDDIIESMANKKITQIFKEDSEQYFRKLEDKVSKWIQTSVKNTLISTGGGFYKVQNLKQLGTVVFLDSSFDKIIKRLKNHPNAEEKIHTRPILKDLRKAREIYNERKIQYTQLADIIINVENKTKVECSQEILYKIKKVEKIA